MINTIPYVTCPCCVCGKTSTVMVDPIALDEWRFGRKIAQDAFPDMSPDERELLISGTHNECWDVLFAPRRAKKDKTKE